MQSTSEYICRDMQCNAPESTYAGVCNTMHGKLYTKIAIIKMEMR